MTKTDIEKTLFTKVHHVGVIVKDMDEAIKHYQSFGMGAFELLELSPAEGLFRGQSLVTTPIISMASVGGTLIELLQPTDEPSLIKEFFENKGEGLHHIAFLADDLDQETDRMVKKGFEVVFSQKFGEGGCAFFDTSKVGGMFIELFRPPS